MTSFAASGLARRIADLRKSSAATPSFATKIVFTSKALNQDTATCPCSKRWSTLRN
ncbi:PTS system mannose/fructose/sorbose family [Listeria monocytogenes]|nr:PTS system mannose/fructose/sorbose family [Listeria monocytogenes]